MLWMETEPGIDVGKHRIDHRLEILGIPAMLLGVVPGTLMDEVNQSGKPGFRIKIAASEIRSVSTGVFPRRESLAFLVFLTQLPYKANQLLAFCSIVGIPGLVDEGWKKNSESVFSLRF